MVRLLDYNRNELLDIRSRRRDGGDVSRADARTRFTPVSLGRRVVDRCGFAIFAGPGDAPKRAAVQLKPSIRACEHRDRVDNLEQSPCVVEPLQRSFPARAELDTRASTELLHRARHEHLAGHRLRRDSSGSVHCDTADVVAASVDLAGVETRPDADLFVSQIVLDRTSRPEPATRTSAAPPPATSADPSSHTSITKVLRSLLEPGVARATNIRTKTVVA